MNRHLFLKVCSSLGATFVAGSAWINLFHQFWRPKILFYSELPENVKALQHGHFARALPNLSLNDILSELIRRDIYNNGAFDIHQIRLNAKGDPLAEFDNFLYTESELLLYAMIDRLALLHVGITVLHAETLWALTRDQRPARTPP